ncbi:hypothetical protein PALB_17640 [Pseudoalteromonas luteoviolacea B = ATCC 29581]|nr:hypothetical protein PALB_17640 [Pseudoalteromonas luteoviolacea B = ATCC 29581]
MKIVARMGLICSLLGMALGVYLALSSLYYQVNLGKMTGHDAGLLSATIATFAGVVVALVCVSVAKSSAKLKNSRC